MLEVAMSLIVGFAIGHGGREWAFRRDDSQQRRRRLDHEDPKMVRKLSIMAVLTGSHHPTTLTAQMGGAVNPRCQRRGYRSWCPRARYSGRRSGEWRAPSAQVNRSRKHDNPPTKQGR
jgi:hypothetical protein